MTSKEAIQILKTSAWLREDEVRNAKRHMAIDMAIEALSCSEIPNGSDAVSRQAAIDAVQNEVEPFVVIEPGTNCVIGAGVKDEDVIRVLEHLPSAEPERDIPMKPIETKDEAWGIPIKQAVCPKCDYYLGRVAFLGDYKGKRITYCETCGQAIDWEGWDFDE